MVIWDALRTITDLRSPGHKGWKNGENREKGKQQEDQSIKKKQKVKVMEDE